MMGEVEEDPSYDLTMERCMQTQTFCQPAAGFCECALPAFDTRFCRLVVQRHTSLLDTEHQDGSPDHQPRAGLQLDSLRSAEGLSKEEVTGAAGPLNTIRHTGHVGKRV